MRLKVSFFAAVASALVGTACAAQDGLSLCPDLTARGTGSRLYEEGRRCVRVMAARYSASGESPGDVATAAIEFCRTPKISPIVDDMRDVVARENLLAKIEDALRKNAIQTVVEMRTGKCSSKPGLFKGVLDPIDGK